MPQIDRLLVLLRVAKEVSAEIPVPGLSSALALALHVAEKAKEITDTRDECRSLAERAAYFSWGIYQQLKQCDSDTQSIATKERVVLLSCTLYDIENLMKRRRKTRALSFLKLRHTNITEEVGKLSTQLEDSIKLFTVQTGVNIEQGIDVLLSMNVRLLQHVEDSARVGDVLLGQTRDIHVGVLDLAQRLQSVGASFEGRFRLFAQENLDLLEPLPEGRTGDRAATQEPGRISRHRAVVKAAGELSGTRVVVHTYSIHDNRLFVEAVNFAKQICNPEILLTVLGYSRPGDPGQASYIVTEDCYPLLEYLSSLHGTSKLRVSLKMVAGTCMAISYLEKMQLRIPLSTIRSVGYRIIDHYQLHVGGLVIDLRNGGRVKWTPDLGRARYDGGWNYTLVPVHQADRMRLPLNDFHDVPDESGHLLMCHWFSQILLDFFAHGPLPGRRLYLNWNANPDRPVYTLGTWLGRHKTRNKHWSVLSNAPIPGFEGATSFEDVHTSQQPTKSMPPYVSTQGSRLKLYSEHPRIRERRITTSLRSTHAFNCEANCGGVYHRLDPESDNHGIRWHRHQVPGIDEGMVLVFKHTVRIPESDVLQTASRIASSAPDPSVIGYEHIGLGTQHVYNTTTTMTIASHNQGKVALPPLWFFTRQHDDDHTKDCAHRRNIPHGFWSLEKHPISIPGDIAFDPTRRFEYVSPDSAKSPISSWTQVLGGLIFSIETKIGTIIMELSNDEQLALGELHGNHYYFPNGTYLGDSPGLYDFL